MLEEMQPVGPSSLNRRPRFQVVKMASLAVALKEQSVRKRILLGASWAVW